MGTIRDIADIENLMDVTGVFKLPNGKTYKVFDTGVAFTRNNHDGWIDGGYVISLYISETNKFVPVTNCAKRDDVRETLRLYSRVS